MERGERLSCSGITPFTEHQRIHTSQSLWKGLSFLPVLVEPLACGSSLLSLMAASSFGLHHFSASVKCCPGAYAPMVHLGSGLQDCAIPAGCSSANRTKDLSLRFCNVQLARGTQSGSAASLPRLLLCTLPAWPGPLALLAEASEPPASQGTSVSWRSTAKGLENSPGSGGFFLFQRGTVNA